MTTGSPRSSQREGADDWGGRCEVFSSSICAFECTGPCGEKRQTRQRRTQRKLEYLESQWHQFASQLSNDGFGMTRHDLGWHVSLFRTGLSCCFPLQQLFCIFTSLSGVWRVHLWPFDQIEFPLWALPQAPWWEWGGVDSGRSYHQFIIEFLLRVMKKTWLLPPERTDAKNT